MNPKDQFSDIFDAFEPDLDSDRNFMSKLSHSIEAVEAVKQRNLEYVRSSRRMIAVSAAAGFVAGMVFMLLLPYFGCIFRSASNMLASAGMTTLADNAGLVLSSLFVIIPTLTVSLTVYKASSASAASPL